MQNLNSRYRNYYPRERKPKSPISWRALIIVFSVIGLFILFRALPRVETVFNFGTKSISKPSPSPLQDPKLAELIQPLIPTDNGDFAVLVKSLRDDRHNYFYQSNRSFPSASLYKLFLLSATYRRISTHSLELGTQLTSNTDYLTDRLGGVDFGYEDITGVITYTVGECLDRIARLSDNFCAVMLSDKIGWDTIQTEANLLGASHTSIQDPITTTPEDISLYFTKLFHSQVVDATASGQIVDLLATNFNKSRIPNLLPQGLKIAHKTGELSRLRHDAGIVYLTSNPYLIVMMSENLRAEDTAIDSMANISKAVYDYFSKLP